MSTQEQKEPTTNTKSQKHSHYTSEQQMNAQQNDTRRKKLLVLTMTNMQKKFKISTPEKLTNNIK